MSSPTELYLPLSFPYPIKVVSLDVKPTASIVRGTRLLSYSFAYKPQGPSAVPETRFGTWDSAIEGEITAWRIKKGDVIHESRAQKEPALEVLEPCKHGMQLNGLCCICGKDMTRLAMCINLSSMIIVDMPIVSITLATQMHHAPRSK